MPSRNDRTTLPLHHEYTRTQLRPCETKGEKGRELSELVMIKYKSEREPPVTLANGSTVPLVQMLGQDEDDDDAIDYNPFHHRAVALPTSDLETLIHLLKGSLGSGILAMPLAFSNAGLWFGLVATCVIGFICTYAMTMLVHCAHKLCKRQQVPSLDFAGVVEACFLSGPEAYHKYSRLAKFVTNCFLVLELLGCCCVYVVFVSRNMKEVIEIYTEVDLNIRYYMVAILPILLMCNMIRDLKYIAPLSLFSNILLITGVAMTFTYLLTDLPPIDSVEPIAPVFKWPMFFGTVIFALEGIGIILPLENNMRTPQHFISCPGVVNIGMTFVVALYAVTGFFGYVKYGDGVQGSITLSLPNDIMAQSIKVMIAIAILFTYNIQFHVPIEIIWHGTHDGKPSITEPGTHNVPTSLRGEYLLRVFLVTVTVLCAIAIPDLGPFISLVGAVCLANLGLTFPALIDTITHLKEGMGPYKWRLWKNGLIFAFGIIGGFAGTYTSIEEIMALYR